MHLGLLSSPQYTRTTTETSFERRKLFKKIREIREQSIAESRRKDVPKTITNKKETLLT